MGFGDSEIGRIRLVLRKLICYPRCLEVFVKRLSISTRQTINDLGTIAAVVAALWLLLY